MSETMKIRNKLTGEIVTIRRVAQSASPVDAPTASPAKEDYSGMVKRVGSDIQGDIANRGDYLIETAKNMQSKNPARIGLGVLQTAGMPLTSAVSGLSNPMLQMQQGNFNPNQLAEEAYKGFTLQKQGRFGDVYRGAGVEKNAAGILGFGAEMMAPAAAISKVNKMFGKLTSRSDLKLEGAGEKILLAGKQAEQIAGQKLSQLFGKVDSNPADANVALDALKRMPKAIMDRVDQEVPELAQGGQFTIASLRKIKQLVGKYAPGKFKKSDPLENLNVADYKESYAKLADLLHTTVRKVANSKEADKLIQAEKNFSQIAKSAGYLRNKIVDSATGFTTKTGELAKQTKNPFISTARKSLDTLKNAGGNNRALISDSVSALESFNRWQAAQGLAQHAVNAATFGGAIGGLGGYMAAKLYGKRNVD